MGRKLEILEEYEIESAKKLAYKKKSMEPKKLKMYLINRGFDTDTVNSIIDSGDE